VLPSAATAKVDFRLVVDQDPHDILEKVRRHLHRHGFSDVEVRLRKTSPPVKTPITDPFVSLVMEAGKRVYTEPLLIQPTSAGAGPRHVFAKWTDMPIVGVGVTHIGSRSHGPDENIRLADYLEGTKHIAAIIELFGA
jgi:acetylornithine deacetylase/succinyl-diaminopimelate desuccinylase-like protein